MDVDNIYGRGKVPHNLDLLYNDAYSKSRSFSFDRTLRNELKSAFSDYKTARFPKPMQYVVIDEEAVE